jgi:hypothetical protein
MISIPRNQIPTRVEFDNVIGRLDRILSEFLLLTTSPIDEADRQTLKHHADDLIGVGNKALEKTCRNWVW